MKKVAKLLLDIDAVVINNQELFTWASGIKSPIYTDNRLINSYPKERKVIEKFLAKLVLKNFPEVQMVIGTATAGISHAAYVSQKLNLPMGYVRSSSKDHGKKKQIEGKDVSGVKVVVIEDLLSTGRSSLEVINILKESNAIVLGLVAIFEYGLAKLRENFQNITYKTLTNLDELLVVAHKHKLIKEEEINLVKEFRNKL